MDCIRWVENVSRDAVRRGDHTDMGPNAMLIQISDPAGAFPVPACDFKEVHQFEFLDAEDSCTIEDEAKIQPEQAQEIMQLLQHAKDKHMNVLVHCQAGICRSGAVVEFAAQIGFTPTERFRLPNLRVKRMLWETMGWGYTQEQAAADLTHNQKTASIGLIGFE